MKPCDSCIHEAVCCLSASEDCEYYKSEADALHTLRLIYADIVQSANRCKAKSQDHCTRNKPESAFMLRREGEIRSSCASRVNHYCRMIGFDPKAEKEEK